MSFSISNADTWCIRALSAARLLKHVSD